MTNGHLTALLSGVGTLEAVACELVNRPSSEGAYVAAINDLVVAIKALALLPDGRELALSLLAAFANSDYRESGRLFHLTGSGKLTYDYGSNDDSRKIIADLAGL